VGLFDKSKTTELPETVPVIPCDARKQIRLNKTLPNETIRAISSETLQAGGWAEPSPAEPQIGDRMPDGTVLAGRSPDTGKPMYAMLQDAPLTYTFNEATAYAKELVAGGHRDWRVPTQKELNVLFNNRAAIGGFNLTSSNPIAWYWSASPFSGLTAWGQRFSDGYQGFDDKGNPLAVRCVR